MPGSLSHQPVLGPPSRLHAERALSRGRCLSSREEPTGCLRRAPLTNITPTFHQSIKQPRAKGRTPSRSPASQKSPQRKGARSRVHIRSPKKPNPAKRKATNPSLPGKARPRVTGHIPGEGHTPQEHPTVPTRGGRVKDPPGAKHHPIPGLSDSKNVQKRKQKRPKHGVKSTKQMDAPVGAPAPRPRGHPWGPTSYLSTLTVFRLAPRGPVWWNPGPSAGLPSQP